MPATPTLTEQVLTQIKGLGDRLGKTESAVEGLVKALETPASRAGVSPEELLHRATQGGRVSGVFGGDGTFLPARPGRAKSMGRDGGKFLCALAEFVGRGNHAADWAAKALFEPVEKGGFGVVKAALAEGSGVTGGYAVPPMFSQNLMQLAVEEAVVRPRASVMPMTSLTLLVPSLDHTTVQGAGNSPFLGGVVAQWTAEAATRAEAEPTFRQTELKAHELSFYTVASNTLLADNAVGLDSLLTTLFSAAIAWYTDYSYIQGNGVGKPLGVLNAPAAITVNRANANKIQFADVSNMFSKMYWLLARGQKLCWLAHQSTFPQLVQMVDAANRAIFIPISAGVQEPIPQSAGIQSAGSVFGVPVIFTEKLPVLGTKGDLILCDWSKYLLGDRQELQIDVSPHVKFLQNSMVWRVVWRGDGQPWLNNPVTLADGAYTVSPFVILN